MASDERRPSSPSSAAAAAPAPAKTSAAAAKKKRTPVDEFIGQYRIGNEIGKGSFATVYKSVHTGSNTAVAIKSVLREKLNKKLQENLESEIKILKTLNHPHIVAMLDCQQSPSYIHLVMEYCSLGDLSYFLMKRDKLNHIPLVASMIRKFPNPAGGGLNETVVRHFLKQLASALRFLRDQNLVHRDIKPQNLLLSPPPRTDQEAIDQGLEGRSGLPVLKLADFGFARILPSASMAETLCGSPLYMAPEILRYEKYDAKADLWSVGTVLYEMSIGMAPFRANNHLELIKKIDKCDDRIKFPDDSPISDEMKRLIKGLLRRNPVELGDIPEVNNVENLFYGMEEDKFIGEYIAKNAAAAAAAAAAASAAVGVTSDMGGSSSNRPPLQHQARPTINMDVAGAVNLAAAARAPPAGIVPLRHGTHQRQLSTSTTEEQVASSRSPSTPRPAGTTVSSITLGSVSGSKDGTLLLVHPTVSGGGKGSRNSLVRPEHDVMFEREYVVVEKRTVEVNALADELQNSPKVVSHGHTVLPHHHQHHQHRRLSSSSSSSSRPAATAPSRVAGGGGGGGGGGGKYGYVEHRRMSYGSSPSSTLARALSMASARLFGRPSSSSSSSSLSPSQSSPPLLATGSYGNNRAVDEREMAVILRVEELGTWSNAVDQFAQVKFSQLLPSTPMSDVAMSSELTADAVLSLSAEALVLFVKSLALLAKAMDIAARWWSNNSSAGASARLNHAVQWVRERFNDTLEKAEFVRMKVSVPSSHDGDDRVSAEKLIYERALEMSRTAAINELVGEDLAGCEMAYETALWMLQALTEPDRDGNVDDEDKRTIDKCKSNARWGWFENWMLTNWIVIASIRNRLVSLRKKIEMAGAPSASGVVASAASTNRVYSQEVVPQQSARMA
ncbi:kinase-like domain-containing protein [Lipomyces japonicus]|uniref:kinase-like domain-containing protein n=1 Tax=Lipomyces japonicus TaxID=56871 RepID=UPI0034CEC363